MNTRLLVPLALMASLSLPVWANPSAPASTSAAPAATPPAATPPAATPPAATPPAATPPAATPPAIPAPPPVPLATVQSVQEVKQALAALEQRLVRLEAQLQNQGLLNLLNQVEALKAELARLRGGQEEQGQQISVAEKRAKDLYADLDGRLKELADRPVSIPVTAQETVRLQQAQSISPVAAPIPAADAEGEAKVYESAYHLVKSGRYKDAVAAFDGFLKQYPNGALVANAWYWLGFSHIAQSDFKGGAAIFQRMIKDYPANPKTPDAMLSLARAHVQLNEPERARTVLDQLLAKHPATRAAENGKRLLATLK